MQVTAGDRSSLFTADTDRLDQNKPSRGCRSPSTGEGCWAGDSRIRWGCLAGWRPRWSPPPSPQWRSRPSLPPLKYPILRPTRSVGRPDNTDSSPIERSGVSSPHLGLQEVHDGAEVFQLLDRERGSDWLIWWQEILSSGDLISSSADPAWTELQWPGASYQFWVSFPNQRQPRPAMEWSYQPAGHSLEASTIQEAFSQTRLTGFLPCGETEEI